MRRICVIGLGKMGLPVAALFASRGHQVIGADINSSLVEQINLGTNPLPHEAGLGDLLERSVSAGRLHATTDTVAAVHASSVIIVLVPLKLTADEPPQADFSTIDSAVECIGEGIQPGTIVIIETTVPVGTTRQRFGRSLEKISGLTIGRDIHLIFSPERVQSNHVLRDLITYPKVLGGVTDACTRAGSAFYGEVLTDNIIALASAEAAEFTKIAECIYRDVNIALANELACCADQAGLDMQQIIQAANSEPLSNLHQPGVGVGGHCIPVYPWFLLNQYPDALPITRQARQTNDAMADYVIDRIREEIGDLAGKQIVILGLAYRANVREATLSASHRLIAGCRAAGAIVRVVDPLFSPAEIEATGALAAPPDLALTGPLHAIIIQAWHEAFTAIDWQSLRGDPLIFDGRRAVDPALVQQAGLRYRAIGYQPGDERAPRRSVALNRRSQEMAGGDR